VPARLQADWLPKAAAAITERIGRYAANEVKVRGRAAAAALAQRQQRRLRGPLQAGRPLQACQVHP
jgi:hypothetical protein